MTRPKRLIQATQTLLLIGVVLTAALFACKPRYAGSPPVPGGQLGARQITIETAASDLFQGSDAIGGVDDWYLSNGVIQAVVDNVGYQQDLLERPPRSELL